ncbi:MAG: RHS repeat-associated core domain-containing protein, partial [Thermoanaerobaculales bacterium]|nr:RHS repeat-associated core domain-containing protein [Thermoanaerobaculales bacterium]
GISYELSLTGLKDRAGNVMDDAELTFVVAEVNAYEVLEDLEQPSMLAVMDGQDGIYLLFDEPVAAATGVNLDEAIIVERADHVVEGTTARVTAQLLQWTATAPAEWVPTGQYEVTQAQVEDRAGQGAVDASLPITLTHLATDAGALLVAYEAAGDSVTLERSAYGVTGLFQGRGWHEDFGLYYYRARWYSPGMVSFLERDPAGYVDGQNDMAFVRHDAVNYVDPLGDVTILIHGANTTAGWFSRAKTGLSGYETSSGASHQEVIEFSWGDPEVGFRKKRKQGGRPHYATDSVADMYSSKKRAYMVRAVERLKGILDRLNLERANQKSTEPINVIAHSQGTIITLGALHLGAEVDNFLMMGSPLDVFSQGKLRENDDLSMAQSFIRGGLYNYWSEGDEWAYIKGGIGAAGDRIAAETELSWIVNREFGPGLTVNGMQLPQDKGAYKEFDHSDYMRDATFFAGIHSGDLSYAGDRRLTLNRSLMSTIQTEATW